MIADWTLAGQPLDLFWQITTREFAAVMRGADERRQASISTAVIGGWIAALETRQEKMHALDDVIGWFEPNPPAPPQTPEQMIGAMRCWVAASGGALTSEAFNTDDKDDEQ